VININKYKQNCDFVACHVKVETDINVHSDKKQAVKWRVFRHVTEYNTKKAKYIDKCVCGPNSRKVLDCESQFNILSPLLFDRPQL